MRELSPGSQPHREARKGDAPPPPAGSGRLAETATPHTPTPLNHHAPTRPGPETKLPTGTPSHPQESQDPSHSSTELQASHPNNQTEHPPPQHPRPTPPTKKSQQKTGTPAQTTPGPSRSPLRHTRSPRPDRHRPLVEPALGHGLATRLPPRPHPPPPPSSPPLDAETAAFLAAPPPPTTPPHHSRPDHRLNPLASATDLVGRLLQPAAIG